MFQAPNAFAWHYHVWQRFSQTFRRTLALMSAKSKSAALSGRAAQYELGANLRALAVLPDGGALPTERQGRIDQIVRLFIESHWRRPRTFGPIQPLSYLLRSGDDDPSFVEDVEALTEALQRHLFGDGGAEWKVEVKYVFDDIEAVEELAAEPVDEFLAAHADMDMDAIRARAAAEAEALGLDSDERAARAPAPSWTSALTLRGVYDTSNTAILSYAASISLSNDPDTAPLYQAFSRTVGEDFPAFEMAALEFAARCVRQQIETGAVAYCIIPLSYETLSSRPRRQAYLQRAAEVPDRVRRYLAPSVFAGPDAPASSSLIELIGATRPLFRIVDWQVSSARIDPERFSHARVHSVTLALPTSATKRSIELARAPTMTRALAALGVRSGITGLENAADLYTAIKAGAHYVSGGAVSAPSSVLAPRKKVAPSALPFNGL